MKTTRHTPGPWHATKVRAHGGTYYRVFSDRDKGAEPHNQTYGHIANVFGDYQCVGTPDGNANLIAAAPDLLAALETLVSSLHWEEKRSGTTYAGYEAARAALRRAKGEE